MSKQKEIRLSKLLKAFGACAVIVLLMPRHAAQAQQHDIDPLTDLKKLTKPAVEMHAGYLYSDAHSVSAQLVRPLALDSGTASSLQEYLSNEQLSWQSNVGKAIDEAKLAKSLNTFLRLDNAPDYLKIRQDQLRRMRVFLAVSVGDLNGGINHKATVKGGSVLSSSMSPFEAYASAGLLLFQKLNNDKFLRTKAEEDAAQANQKTEAALTPGLHILPISDRQFEFQRHFEQIRRSENMTASSIVQTMQSIFEVSRQ